MTMADKEIEIILEPFPCTECSAGMMHPRLITYFTWLSEELVTVPNFPAWVCDMCGKRQYDEKAIAWLNMMLDPNTGKTTMKKRKAKLRHKPRPHSHRPTPDS
jgi:YgiT-type zinc finger domain-containing protein